jgi:hypothetical protein
MSDDFNRAECGIKYSLSRLNKYMKILCSLYKSEIEIRINQCSFRLE